MQFSRICLLLTYMIYFEAFVEGMPRFYFYLELHVGQDRLLLRIYRGPQTVSFPPSHSSEMLHQLMRPCQ